MSCPSGTRAEIALTNKRIISFPPMLALSALILWKGADLGAKAQNSKDAESPKKEDAAHLEEEVIAKDEEISPTKAVVTDQKEGVE